MLEGENSEEIYVMHARVCRVLADAKRLRIINALRNGERTVSELAQLLGLRQTNLSQHLMLLRERGVVTTRRQGPNVYYSLSSQKIVEACELMREVLAEHLARAARLSQDLQAPAKAEIQA